MFAMMDKKVPKTKGNLRCLSPNQPKSGDPTLCFYK
jgi:hypothetical protein